MKTAGAQRVVDALQIEGAAKNSEQSEHDGAVRGRPVRKDLGTWSKDFQRMAVTVQMGTQTSRVVVSYTMKVMLFCLALTMCIIGVSQQIGLSLTH